MTTPWLSVLMPIYNGAATLPRTLASLSGQVEGCEVIAVVQKSDDGSRSILEAHENSLNLRIIDAPESESWMTNTNIALAEAKAPHVTMLHQDDLWRAGRSAALGEMAATMPDAKMWLHAAEFIDDQDRVVGRFAPPFGSKASLLPSEEALAHLLVQNTVALPAVMFRRDDALAPGGLDEDLWYTADWDLWLRLAALGPVAWNPTALAAFRIHSGSLTMTGSRNVGGFRQQLAIPVDRHITALPPEKARKVGHLAKISNDLNVCLAGAYHGHRVGLWPLGLQILRLGPIGWYRFFRDTNIVGRVLPRLRLRQKS
ncbi:glycosyltransferase family 2 protein [Aliiroseovarius sp. YM-037]|uniref:glycosyltransferase family 2 protein n=1 Tax=Aliiroseovarius sp. YM-037 TaxID=3341728 RepID=UPI003A807C06